MLDLALMAAEGNLPHRYSTKEALVLEGDSLLLLPLLPDNSIDSVVTDPPYDLTDDRDPRRGFPQREEDGEWSAQKRKGFMNRDWDGTGIAFRPDLWAEVLRVLKPGGHLVSFGGTRTYHHMATAVYQAGFEIRDMLEWFYGTGFPKNYDAAKGLEGLLTNGSASWNDFHLLNGERGPEDSRGANGMVHENYRQGSRPSAYTSHGTLDLQPTTEEAAAWEGWGTALKPGHEPICLARKPLSEANIALNMLRWGTGAINIDATRLPSGRYLEEGDTKGRWPPNLLLTHSVSCRMKGHKRIKSRSGPASGPTFGKLGTAGIFGPAHGSAEGLRPKYHADKSGHEIVEHWECDEGCPVRLLSGQQKGADRFYPTFSWDFDLDLQWLIPFHYSGKASKREKSEGLDDLPPVKVNDGRTTEIDNPYQRAETERKNPHPTVKPASVMRWLCKLVTPPGGVVLDPFYGSGSTGVAAVLDDYGIIGIEMGAEYVPVSCLRTDYALALKQGRKYRHRENKLPVEADPGKLAQMGEGVGVLQRGVQAGMQLVEMEE